MTTRTLLVAYDLSPASEARSRLASAVMSLGEAWARPLDTVWLLRTSLSMEDVEHHLTLCLGADDGLMVQETRGEGRFANTAVRWFRPRREAADVALAEVARLAYAGGPDSDKWGRAA